MPTIGEMLTTPAFEALIDMPLAPEPLPEPPEPQRFCGCGATADGFRHDGEKFVHHRCGLVKEVVPNLRGAVGQPVTVQCAGGCGDRVTVVVRKVPTEHTGKPRIPVCVDCARTMTAGKSGQVLRTPVARRSDDGRGHPQALMIPDPKDAMPQIDLDTMTDAELGAAVRSATKRDLAAKIPAKQKKAKKAKAAKEKAATKAKKAERADLSAIGVLEGFMVKGVDVPALDVSAIENLDEAVPPKVRSPYNRVRYRLKMDLLPHASAAAIKADPTAPQTTWATLIGTHTELAAMTETKTKKPRKQQIAAPVDLDEKGRIAVLRTTLGVDKKTARKMLAEIGA